MAPGGPRIPRAARPADLAIAAHGLPNLLNDVLGLSKTLSKTLAPGLLPVLCCVSPDGSFVLSRLGDEQEYTLNTETNKSGGGTRQGARPVVLIGVVAVAVLVVLAAVLLRKPPTDSQKQASQQTQEVSVVTTATNPAWATQTTDAPPAERAPAHPAMGTNVAGAAGPAGPTTEKPQVPVKDLIKALKDASLPLLERKAAIQALAKLGTREAIDALKEALKGGSEELRAAIAEGLGDCGTEECTAMLLGLLNDGNEAVARAAVRGLAAQGTVKAAETLAKLLNDGQRSVDMRIEAALGLGTIEQPGVLETLQQAARTIGDEDIVTQVLNAIGGRDFSETQAFFQQYLGSAPSSDLRVAAIESLWQAKGDPTAFLAGYISDPDAEVRASAAWAMSATDATGNAGPQLLASLQGEQDADVRLRLYQALRNQESFDTGTALALVQREADSLARVAGMDLLASSLRNNPTPEVQTFFDQTAAPALKNTALTGESSHERMAAVIALVRASTPSAMSALQDLAQQATDPRVKDSAAKIVANPLPVMPKPNR